MHLSSEVQEKVDGSCEWRFLVEVKETSSVCVSHVCREHLLRKLVADIL